MTYEVRYQRGAQCGRTITPITIDDPTATLSWRSRTRPAATDYDPRRPRRRLAQSNQGRQVRGLPPVSESLLLPSSGRQGFAILDGKCKPRHGFVVLVWLA